MNNNKTRIGILGINGRMGRMLAQACLNANLDITVATGRIGSTCIGRELGDFLNQEPLNIVITDDFPEGIMIVMLSLILQRQKHSRSILKFVVKQKSQ